MENLLLGEIIREITKLRKRLGFHLKLYNKVINVILM